MAYILQLDYDTTTRYVQSTTRYKSVRAATCKTSRGAKKYESRKRAETALENFMERFKGWGIHGGRVVEVSEVVEMRYIIDADNFTVHAQECDKNEELERDESRDKAGAIARARELIAAKYEVLNKAMRELNALENEGQSFTESDMPF